MYAALSWSCVVGCFGFDLRGLCNDAYGGARRGVLLRAAAEHLSTPIVYLRACYCG